MGNDQSKGEFIDDGSAAVSSTYSRMDKSRGSLFDEPSSLSKQTYRAELVKSAYTGIWSIENAIGAGPTPRTGQFTASSPDLRRVYIGYGVKASKEFTNDVWALSTETNSWRRMHLTGMTVSPRTGATACMMGKYIVVFGGFLGGENYVSDLHTIDIETGLVQVAPINGRAPEGRSFAVMGIHNQKLFVWGGFNGSNLTDLNIMEFATMTWRTVQTGVESRPSAPFAQYGTRIFTYGGSSTGGFLCVDMEEESVNVVASSGALPSSEVTRAGLVKIGSYLFFFGGKAKNSWTMVYACDMEKMWWFAFFVAPDDVTTTSADGRVSSEGLFMLPKFSSFSSVYDEKKRTIYAFLGRPHKSPPPLFLLSIGDAMGVINMREDMRSQFLMDMSRA